MNIYNSLKVKYIYFTAINLPLLFKGLHMFKKVTKKHYVYALNPRLI
jgi:hypothetical protein